MGIEILKLKQLKHSRKKKMDIEMIEVSEPMEVDEDHHQTEESMEVDQKAIFNIYL